MKQINIICKVKEEADFQVENEFLEYNINKNDTFTYTFWNNNLMKLPNFFSRIGLDMLYVSLFIFGIDRRISRELAADCWTRKIRLSIPVLEPAMWNKNKELITEMLTFLSGDLWELEFRKRDYTDTEIKYRKKIEDASLNKLNVDKICMFSGGLDSFIGAIDILKENSQSNALFVSHYGGGKGVKEYQDMLKDKLISTYNISEENFFSFYASAKHGTENTTRTRSFMFFCHAIALSTSFNCPINLIIPENGLISLNIPLTNSRLGSSSTRTTHPHYLAMLQKLLNNFGIKVSIYNPYQFQTKGDMIRYCKDLNFLEKNISNTMSCSHPDQGRMLGESEPCHCGNCLPCVIRRAAIKKSGMEDPTNYRDWNFTSGETATLNLASYKLGIEKHKSKFAFLNIQRSGPITRDVNKYANLYVQGMQELQLLLEDYSE